MSVAWIASTSISGREAEYRPAMLWNRSRDSQHSLATETTDTPFCGNNRSNVMD